MCYYKFALKSSENDSMLIDLIDTIQNDDGETSLFVSTSYMVNTANLSKARKLFINTKTKQTENQINVWDCIKDIFEDLDNSLQVPTDQLQKCLQEITKQFVFTFPLRSIGPLQWSESDRISIEHREENYKEAENRCEIIKYFLKDNGEKFDKDKEKKYFQQITQCKDYNFELIDGKIHVQKGKFALLKTPEGILEAKAFSILISSKQFKTIILEEPDRGMHPQLIERMILLMKQEKNDTCVLLTTHQKGFITPWTVPDIFIFRRSKSEAKKENGTENRIISGKSIFDGYKKTVNMTQMRLVTSHHVPDMFFAGKVLFYEGDSEDLFLRELKSQIVTCQHSDTLKRLYGENEDVAKCLVEYTFIKMNGKDNRDLYRTVSDNLQLDYLFLLDKDAEDLQIGIPNKEIERQLESERDCEDIRIKILDVRTKPLQEKHTFFWLYGDIEKMVTTMCDNCPDLHKELLKLKVISKIDESHCKIAGKTKKKRNGKKIKPKLFLGNKINSTHISESVSVIIENCNSKDDLTEFINILK